MTNITQWIVCNPWTAVGLTFWHTALALLMGFRDDAMGIWIGCFLAGLTVFARSMIRMKTAMVVGLMLACQLQEVKAQVFPEREVNPAGVGVAVGVGVICVGTYCIYKFVKFCEKKFPKDEKSNSLSGFYAQGEDETGAAFSYGAMGSCAPWDGDFSPTSQTGTPTTFNLNIYVDPYAGPVMTMTANVGEQFSQTAEEFFADMLSHGLYLSGRPDGAQSFSRNRIPCDASEVPITFDPVTATVRNGLAGSGETQTIIVERSRDLRLWSAFVKTEVGAGAGFRVVDTTQEGQMFYRVTTRPAQATAAP